MAYQEIVLDILEGMSLRGKTAAAQADLLLRQSFTSKKSKFIPKKPKVFGTIAEGTINDVFLYG